MGQVLPLWYYCITTTQTPETIESNYGESEDAHVTEGHVRCAIQSLFIKHLTINIEGRCDFFIFRCPLEKVVRATGWLFKYLNQQSLEGLESVDLQPIAKGASKKQLAFQVMLRAIVGGSRSLPDFDQWVGYDLLRDDRISESHQCFRSMVALGFKKGAKNVWESFMDEHSPPYTFQGDLSLAAGEGHLEVAQYLLKKGAPVLGDPNHLEMAGVWNPMHCAAFKGQLAVMRLLHQKREVTLTGNMDTIPEETTQTYFQAAAFGGRPEAPEVVRLLASFGEEINLSVDNIREYGLRECLPIGAARGNPELMEVLIECGAFHTLEDVEVVERSKRSAEEAGASSSSASKRQR